MTIHCTASDANVAGLRRWLEVGTSPNLATPIYQDHTDSEESDESYHPGTTPLREIMKFWLHAGYY